MLKVVNSSYQEIRVGQIVDRLDNFKSNGEVLAVNREHKPPVLVRWPWNTARGGDEWCRPDLLVPREVSNGTE